jgi:5-carboxymethyl-2-hydroxymuconate isomerase
MAEATAQQDVVQLSIRILDGKSEMPGQRSVTGDLLWAAIRHVQVAHQDHRLGQGREVPSDAL